MSKSNKIAEEYYNLRSKLSVLGLYEKGMDIEEMQQIESLLYIDENADFQNSIKHNSTMISFSGNTNYLESGFISHEDCIQNTLSPPLSPINSSEKIIVIAQVHHELNYSPESAQKKLDRKQKVVLYNSDSNIANNNSNIDDNSFMKDAQVHHELNYSPESAQKKIDRKQKVVLYKSDSNIDNNNTNIVDSGLYLDNTTIENRRKNLETFFKNVSLLK